MSVRSILRLYRMIVDGEAGKLFVLCDYHQSRIKLPKGGYLQHQEGKPGNRRCFKCLGEGKKKLLDAIYYNTTRLEGDELVRRLATAKNQDERILIWLTEHPESDFTRDELHVLVMPEAQNSSVTRSLNTLMNKGYIDKLQRFRQGNMKHKQHLWQIRSNG